MKPFTSVERYYRCRCSLHARQPVGAPRDRRHRADRPHIVVGAGARVRRRARLVRQPLRVAAGAGLRLVRHRRADRGRTPSATAAGAARADPAVHPGFTIVFTLLGAFASTFVQLFRGTTGQRIGGAIVVAFGVLMIGYAIRRGSIALYAERRPFLPASARAAWAPCRSAWRSPRAGRRASARCWGPSSRSPRRAARPRAVLLLVSYSAGLGRAVPAGGPRGRHGSWARSGG